MVQYIYPSKLIAGFGKQTPVFNLVNQEDEPEQ